MNPSMKKRKVSFSHFSIPRMYTIRAKSCVNTLRINKSSILFGDTLITPTFVNLVSVQLLASHVFTRTWSFLFLWIYHKFYRLSDPLLLWMYFVDQFFFISNLYLLILNNATILDWIRAIKALLTFFVLFTFTFTGIFLGPIFMHLRSDIRFQKYWKKPILQLCLFYLSETAIGK